METATIDTYLAGCRSLARYDRAFKFIWAMACAKKLTLKTCTLLEVSALVLDLSKISLHQARNAYSGLLLVPGFEQLRFAPLLKGVKKVWGKSQPKYAGFWDASPLLKKLAQDPVDWGSVVAVRLRLILSLRLVQFLRSVDLSRVFRTVSFINDQPYLLIRRKGALEASWEAVVMLPASPYLCPWTLLQHYVGLTSHVPSGSPLFCALQSPFAPLSASSLGSLTKSALQKLGLPSFWGAHSTRGAGVSMYRALGLTAEQVCEIGKWKNVTTFTNFYSRLGSASVASSRLFDLVHNVSPWEGAEPERSRSPTYENELGRSDLEGGAPKHGETRFCLPAVLLFCVFWLVRVGLLLHR